MSSIDEFKAEVTSTGLARNNRFAFTFSLPAVLSGGANPYNTTMRKATLLCENAQIPGVNLNTIQNRTFGEYRETPYETVYDNINVTFYVDKEMKIKKLFDQWILGIQGWGGGEFSGSRNFQYYNDYTSDATIYVFDVAENAHYGVRLYEVYPKTIGAITMDNNNKDIMKLSITFQYKYWRPSSINESSELPFNELGQWLGSGSTIATSLNSLGIDVASYNPF